MRPWRQPEGESLTGPRIQRCTIPGAGCLRIKGRKKGRGKGDKPDVPLGIRGYSFALIDKTLHSRQASVRLDDTNPGTHIRLIGDIERLARDRRSQPKALEQSTVFHVAADETSDKILARRNKSAAVRREIVPVRIRQAGRRDVE